jgi:hypothetical protein
MGASYVGAYTLLGTVWYANSLTPRFRWFNDNREWLQLDKLGHAYGAYLECRVVHAGLLWAGVRPGARLLWGSLAGFLLQSPIEVLDGFSDEWGASWGDLAANATGSLLFFGNQALWGQQRIQLKWGYLPSPYAAQAPRLLGTAPHERMLKDYNGHTYWLTTHLGAWAGGASWAARWGWLGVGLGYGGRGMLGGYFREPWDVIRAREWRQWLLSLDVDLSRIPTRRRGLRLLFQAVGLVRIPLPALVLSRHGLGISIR